MRRKSAETNRNYPSTTFSKNGQLKFLGLEHNSNKNYHEKEVTNFILVDVVRYIV
jgi:hypothetical protein